MTTLTTARAGLEVTVLMPCLNEAETVATCVRKAVGFLDEHGIDGEIVVADNGPGIPEADRGRVKDRFVRLDAARGGSGSGLGLSIVTAAAKLHGGELRLEDNRPGLRAILTLVSRT